MQDSLGEEIYPMKYNAKHNRDDKRVILHLKIVNLEVPHTVSNICSDVNAL